MNFISDPRQAYFKNKLTALMMNGNVVKTLTKAPTMTKKEQPLEVVAQVGSAAIPSPLQNNQTQMQPAVQTRVKHSNSFMMFQKKKEMEMRLAYEAQQNKRESLGRMFHQHSTKLQKFNTRISKLMTDHEQKLRERINLRKLKTATFRSRRADIKDKISKQNDFQENGEETEGRNPIDKKQNKRWRSLEQKVTHDLSLEVQKNKRVRKWTQDWTSQYNKSRTNTVCWKQTLAPIDKQAALMPIIRQAEGVK